MGNFFQNAFTHYSTECTRCRVTERFWHSFKVQMLVYVRAKVFVGFEEIYIFSSEFEFEFWLWHCWLSGGRLCQTTFYFPQASMHSFASVLNWNGNMVILFFAMHFSIQMLQRFQNGKAHWHSSKDCIFVLFIDDCSNWAKIFSSSPFKANSSQSHQIVNEEMHKEREFYVGTFLRRIISLSSIDMM